MPRRALINALTFGILMLVACTAPTASGPETSLTVFAAASLTEVFSALGQAFEASHPDAAVTFNFAGSQQLAFQIEQGARADVFASADPRNVDKLVAAGLVAPDAPAIFARNRLVVIVPGANPGQVETLRDLAQPGLKLVIATQEAPVGAYTRQLLDRLAADAAYGSDFGEAVRRNVVSNEENVKQVVAKVRLGEADAGIVYHTDVTPDLTGHLRVIDIPADYNVSALYPLAVLQHAPHPDPARAFVRFVLAPEGRRILEAWGFTQATE